MSFSPTHWQSRWNESQGIAAAISQTGSEVMATCLVGAVMFDLEKTADVEAIVTNIRLFADMIEETKQRYDETMRDMRGYHPE